MGGRPSAFGLPASGPNGVSLVPGRLIVRWETVHSTPVVTAVATVWTQADQQNFLTSDESLRSLADQFVSQWAPLDSAYVTQTRIGGAALFAYRSDMVVKALGSDTTRLDDAGDLYVFIVLESSFEDREVPIIAADSLSGPNLEQALFTIGLVLGQPWPGSHYDFGPGA